jgi:hypothetical protein
MNLFKKKLRYKWCDDGQSCLYYSAVELVHDKSVLTDTLFGRVKDTKLHP